MKKQGVNIRMDSSLNYLDREFDDDGRLMMLDSEQLNNLELKNWIGRVDDIL